MSAPDVSIILPVFNAGRSLVASLDRLDRTCTDKSEVIIVDDGSTDGTADIISNYAATRDHVSAILLEINAGVANARNTALRKARGDYVWFVDWDDDWHEDIVQAMLARARYSGADAVVCRSRWRLDTGLDLGLTESIQADITQESQHDAFDHILRGDLKGYLWSKLLRRDRLPDDMFPRMSSRSDFCGIVPVLAASRSIALEPRVLYHHVVRSGSITNSREPNLDDFAECNRVVRETAAGLPVTARRELLVLRFEYETISAGRVNTALRLSSPETARREIGAAASAMHFKDIVRIARVSPRTAFRSFLVKSFGEQFVFVRQIFVVSRNFARSKRLPSPTAKNN